MAEKIFVAFFKEPQAGVLKFFAFQDNYSMIFKDKDNLGKKRAIKSRNQGRKNYDNRSILDLLGSRSEFVFTDKNKYENNEVLFAHMSRI